MKADDTRKLKTKIWRTADGRDYQLRQMETDHIKRCILFILGSMRIGVPRRTKFLIPLCDELIRRGAAGMYFTALRETVIKERLRRRAEAWLIKHDHDAPVWKSSIPLSFQRHEVLEKNDIK